MMHQSASERARLRRGVPPAMVPDATPFCSGWGGAPEPEPEPSWLAAAAVRKAAGSKACSTCGERGHLRYACPVRLAALNAAQSITAAEQRLAWARLLQFDSSGTDSPEQLPRRVLERVVQLLPPIATPKVTARGGLWAEPGSAATSHWHSAEARSSRRAKLQRQRQRRQAEERAQRHAEWDGMEKAERSAWFNAKELAKAAQRELVAAAAAAAAAGGGGVIRVVVDLGYDAVMNDKVRARARAALFLLWRISSYDTQKSSWRTGAPLHGAAVHALLGRAPPRQVALCAHPQPCRARLADGASAASRWRGKLGRQHHLALRFRPACLHLSTENRRRRTEHGAHDSGIPEPRRGAAAGEGKSRQALPLLPVICSYRSEKFVWRRSPPIQSTSSAGWSIARSSLDLRCAGRSRLQRGMATERSAQKQRGVTRRSRR